MNNVFVATDNPHKLQKITAMFTGTDVHIDSPKTLPIHLKIDENAETFEGNAALKATAYSGLYNGLVIATDGGMLIPALEDWDPMRTKRFAGEDASDETRIELILDKMKDRTGDERAMIWHEAIALAQDGKKLFSVEVTGSTGMLATQYDPAHYRPGIWLCSIWEFPQFGNKNFFDLTPAQVDEAEISWVRLGVALQQFLRRSDNM